VTLVAYEVIQTNEAARPTLVVRAGTTWPEFASRWKPMLDEVWAFLRANNVTSGCRNIMLYLDDQPNVEVGVISPSRGNLTGQIVVSELPAGSVATTVHHGPYADLGAAHDAVQQWCAARGLSTAGPRWEVYGPHHDDTAQLETQVYYLLAP
jgi:effector-binding domain-containing protein